MYLLQPNGAEHNTANCKRNLRREPIDFLAEILFLLKTRLKLQIVEADFIV